MRILTVTHFFETHGGGIELVAGHLCRHFTALGHKASWAASDEDAPPVEIDTVPLRCFNVVERLSGLPLPIPTLSAMLTLWRTVRACDAVVIHDALYLTSIVAMIAARRGGRPVVLIQHVASIPFPNPLLRAAMRLANVLVTRTMLRAADHVVYISATTRDAFADAATKHPPLLLFNGVDPDIFNPGSIAEIPSVRRYFGLPIDQPLVLFVGRFVEKKGLPIVAALARLRPDLHFALAGHGVINPESWALANVTVFRGLSKQSLAPLYRTADVLLLPSVGEGYPLVIQEALASGLPVVCGAEAAVADPDAAPWLTGIDIHLARPEDTAALAATAIDSITISSSNATASTARAERARYAVDTYSWERTATRILALLDTTGAQR